MKMRRSLTHFERRFEQEAVLQRARHERLRSQAVARSRHRRIVRTEQRGKVRFSVLAITLTLTVVIVTWAMFETLSLLMG